MSDPACALIALAPAQDAEAARRSAAEALAETEGTAAVIVPLALEHPDALDALAWLARQHGAPRGWFRERDREHVIAGLGVFQQIDASDMALLDDLERYDAGLPQDARVPFVLTARFDLTSDPDEQWEPFGCVRAVRHAVTWEQRGEDVRLVVLRDGVAPCPTLMTWLQADDGTTATSTSRPKRLYRKEEPDLEGWNASVRSALQEIRDGDVEKVVLARRQVVHMADDVDPHTYAAALGNGASETFSFLVAPEAGTAFVGATPELLYMRDERHLETEALAGTRRRGLSDVEDERLEEELTASQKEQHEHALVGAHLAGILETFTAAPPVCGALTLRRLPTVQHLLTRMEATLKDEVSDRMVVEALAPTPAVCGTPRDIALEAIRFYERFDRGLYAGIVGLVSPRSVVLTVAIRSVLLIGSQAIPYAGAGIVAGSEPEEEWAETELKFAPAIEPLGDDDAG